MRLEVFFILTDRDVWNNKLIPDINYIGDLEQKEFCNAI